MKIIQAIRESLKPKWTNLEDGLQFIEMQGISISSLPVLPGLGGVDYHKAFKNLRVRTYTDHSSEKTYVQLKGEYVTFPADTNGIGIPVSTKIDVTRELEERK